VKGLIEEIKINQESYSKLLSITSADMT